MKNSNLPPTAQDMQDAAVTLQKMIDGHYFTAADKVLARQMVELLMIEEEEA